MIKPRGEFEHQVITDDENPNQIQQAKHDGGLKNEVSRPEKSKGGQGKNRSLVEFVGEPLSLHTSLVQTRSV